ncbi:MAG: hypothetical protein Q4B52_01745 [Tissierellia bacterium]|nr:hypothetical protein [Tissierellia bacterium]
MKKTKIEKKEMLALLLIYIMGYVCLYFLLMDRNLNLRQLNISLINKIGYFFIIALVIGFIILVTIINILVLRNYLLKKKIEINRSMLLREYLLADVLKNALIIFLITVIKLRLTPILYIDIIMGSLSFYFFFSKFKNSHMINLSILRFILYIICFIVFLVIIVILKHII